LMEFHDMANVYDVDKSMVARTAEWLRHRRDGHGGYQRSSEAVDSFGGAGPEGTNAYITWALAEADTSDIGAEADAQAPTAGSTKDPYVLALAANTLVDQKRGEAKAALERLAAMQDKDGSFPGAAESITRSGGDALVIETTALAALALMKDGPGRTP